MKTLTIDCGACNCMLVGIKQGQLFFSYSTPVAAVINGKGYVTDAKYSNTTSKQISTKFIRSCIAQRIEVSTMPEGFFALLAHDNGLTNGRAQFDYSMSIADYIECPTVGLQTR